jgi:hypothetical protein
MARWLAGYGVIAGYLRPDTMYPGKKSEVDDGDPLILREVLRDRERCLNRQKQEEPATQTALAGSTR